MKKNLHLIKNNARLRCLWIPTGNVRTPLACNWIAALAVRKTATRVCRNPAPSNDELGGLHLCA